MGLIVGRWAGNYLFLLVRVLCMRNFLAAESETRLSRTTFCTRASPTASRIKLLVLRCAGTYVICIWWTMAILVVTCTSTLFFVTSNSCKTCMSCCRAVQYPQPRHGASTKGLRTLRLVAASKIKIKSYVGIVP